MKTGIVLVVLALISIPLPVSAKDACALVCPIDTELDAEKCVCVDARGVAPDPKAQTICTADLCPDGSARDPKTCACPDNTK